MSPKSDKPLPAGATSTVLREPKRFVPWDFAHPEFPTSRRYYNAYRAAIPRKPARHDSSHVSSKHERKSPIYRPETRTPEKIAPCFSRLGATMTINSRRPSSDRHAVLRQTAISSAISKARRKNAIQMLRARPEPRRRIVAACLRACLCR